MLANEEALHSKEEFLEQIDVAMGGLVAEELFHGKEQVSAGCSSDLDKATSLAQSMIKKFGMFGQSVGYIYVQDEGYSWQEDTTSNKYKSLIDENIKLILKVIVEVIN